MRNGYQKRDKNGEDDYKLGTGTPRPLLALR